MKFILILIAFLVCFLSLLNPSLAMKTKQRSNAKEGCIVLYKDCNYEGSRVELCEDQPDLRIINFRDQTSGISLGKNVRVQIFEESDYKGRSVIMSNDQSCLIGTEYSSFNDKINSIKIIPIPPERPEQGCVRIFSKCYYQGLSYMFCNDRPFFSKKYYNSESVASVWVGENTELQLYLEKNMQGTNKSFSQDFDCLNTCVGWKSNRAKSASVFTVVKTQKRFTDEEMKKLEEEELIEEKIKKQESEPEFFSVEYAAYGDLDITEKIRSLINSENHSLTFSAVNDSFGSTLSGVFKTAHLFFWSKGKMCIAGVKDNEVLNISVNTKGHCYAIDYTTSNLKIYGALWGGNDVTQIMRDIVSKNKDFRYIEAKADLFGVDPLPGWKKTLSVYFEIDNVRVKTTITEGEKIDVRTDAKKLEELEKERIIAEHELKIKKEQEEKVRKDAEQIAEIEKHKREEDVQKKNEEEKMKFSIIEAQYGPNIVTDLVKSKIVNNSLVFQITSKFPTLPEDYLKMATIFYWSNFKVCYRTIRGDESITIDSNPATDEKMFCHEPPAKEASKIHIYLATFGGTDITNIIRENAKNDKFSSIKASSAEFGKPLPGWQNSLFIYYSIGNAFVTRIMLENEKIVFLEEVEKKKTEEENKKRELEKALEDAKIEQENKKYVFSIAGVSYGPSDFTDFSKTLIKNDTLVVKPNNSDFGDTWVEMKKSLHIFYWYKDQICVLNKLENTPIIEISKGNSNKDGNCHDKPVDNKNGITIYSASYGVNDVTEQMRKMFNGKNTVQLTYYSPNVKDFDMETVKDGLLGRSFSVYFKLNGVFFFYVIVDGESIDFLKIYEKYEFDKQIKQEVVQKAEIIIANYGSLRVTDRVRKLVELSTTSKVTIQASNTVFGDPSPWLLKTASVLYKINGKYCVSNALQNDNLVIDISDSLCYKIPDDETSKTKIRVLAASYAGMDVTEILRAKFTKESIAKLVVDDSSIVKTTLDNKWLKVLTIQYILEGQIFTFILKEGSVVDFAVEEKKRKETEIRENTYFQITHTSYGPLEVTDKVKLMVNNENYSLKFRPENRLFGDSWKGNSPKYSHVFYLLHNRFCVANSIEFGEINIGIDNPNPTCYDEPGNTKSGVKIEAASWGDRDVTEFLRKKSMDSKFSVIFAEDSYFGDPLKTLSVQFVVNGKRFNRIIKEHEVIDLIETEIQESGVKIKRSRAEEDFKKSILEQQQVAIAKQKLLDQANQKEKHQELIMKLQDDENSHLNEEKIALLKKELNMTNRKMATHEEKKIELERKQFIERYYLNKIKIKSKKGSIVKNNSIITLTHVNTGSRLYSSVNNKNRNGDLRISGYRTNDNSSNVYWRINGENKNIQNLDTIKLSHRDSKTYLFSKRGQLSKLNGQQEVLAIKNNKDVSTNWKVIIYKNYGNSDNLKVGDIIKLKNVNSDRVLTANREKDYSSDNNQVFAKTTRSKEKDDDLFVISEIK